MLSYFLTKILLNVPLKIVLNYRPLRLGKIIMINIYNI
jgi:hypothetical protein